MSKNPDNELTKLRDKLKKQQELVKELKNEATIYKTIVEASTDALFLETPDGKILDANEKAVELLGYTKEELLKLTVFDLVPEKTRKELPKLFHKIKLKKGVTIEAENLRKDGKVIPVEVSSKLFSFKGEEILSVEVRDITQRKKLEKELKESLENQLRINDELMQTTIRLKESEEKYRNLIEHSNDGIYILIGGKFILVNKKFEEIIGYTFNELNSPEFVFESTIAPEDRQMIRLRGEKLKRGEEVSSKYRFRCVTKSGTKKYLETSVSYVKYEGEIATHGIVRDITEQRKLEEQFLQSQKMEAIGKLAGGIAHDFNNLLTGILGFAELLYSRAQDEKTKHASEVILTTCRQAAKLTAQLLNFSRKGEFNPEPISINESIRNVLTLLEKMIHKDIEINCELQDKINITEADSGQVEQAIMNVVLNSFDAMPKGGQVSISSSNVFLDEKYCSSFPNLKPGNYVKVSVTDTGTGMTDEVKSRVFEPFFSTKGKGEGTGLGLSTVYGIMKNHNGHINIYSEINEGTTVNVYLPVVKAKKGTQKETKVEFLKGSETILLIDDEKVVRKVGKEILEELGYKSLIASSGEEGIRLYKENIDDIKLVILDMIMPDMDGETTYQKLKKINPDIKVIIASGYSQNGTAEKIVKKEKSIFVQKPFQIKELSDSIRKILDKSN